MRLARAVREVDPAIFYSRNLKFNQYLKMLEIIQSYRETEFSMDDYIDMREDLRRNHIPFSNIELEKALAYFGFSVPH